MCSQNDCWYHHTYVYTTKCLSIVLGEKWNFLTSTCIMYWLPSIMLQVSGSLKSSFCEDRRMKDTQSLKCEDRRHQNFLALETEDLVTHPLAILLLSVHRSKVQVVVV